MKYFTPDISDIRIGYKCDHSSMGLTFDKHNPNIVLDDDDLVYDEELAQCDVADITYAGFIEGSLSGFVRTKYLTDEEIEKEGWRPVGGILFRKDNYTLGYREDDRILKIATFSEDSYNLYFGECKDINTFKWICKLLKI